MKDEMNRYFVFKLPHQALKGILDIVVEKEESNIRTSLDGKYMVVKLPVGNKTNYDKLGFATEYTYEKIKALIQTPEWQDNNITI